MDEKFCAEKSYGAAPPPDVPIYYIKVSPASSSPPGLFIWPAQKDNQPSIAIKRYYYVKNKQDLSYVMTPNGKGQIQELGKDNSLVLTLEEAKMVVNGLITQLKRNGFEKEDILMK